MPEWRSSHEHRVRTVVRDGVETRKERFKKKRFIRFNIDRATLVVFGLVIAELASWIDRYA